MGFDLKSLILFWVILSNIALFLAEYRIIGGDDVDDDEYIPYQISLQIWRNKLKEYEHFCSGSIVTPTRIVTAAHCLENVQANELSVVAGVRDLNDTTGQRSKVLSFKVHKDYKPLVTGDICILKIDPPFKLDGKRVDKIDVNGAVRVGAGRTLLITGWGSTAKKITYPNRLQKLYYRSISNSECKRHMSNLTDAELCAWSRHKNRGTCIGDSGGPLVMRKGVKVFQVGLISYGNRVCGYNAPNVFTRISSFAKWIKALIKK